MILKFATFNPLAVAYLGHGEYSRKALELLRSERRIPLLLKLIASLKADVIGLQEVEEPLFDALKASGHWRAEWAPKTMNKPDGCALLFRPHVVADNYISASYSDGSGHVWQSVEIDGVTVVNTHIKWAAEDEPDHIGASQTEKLLRYLEGRRAIILSDCNSRPGERVRNLIEAAGFNNVWGSAATALVVKDGVAERAPIDLIALRDITGEPVGKLRSVATIPNQQCPSDHIPVMASIQF